MGGPVCLSQLWQQPEEDFTQFFTWVTEVIEGLVSHGEPCKSLIKELAYECANTDYKQSSCKSTHIHLKTASENVDTRSSETAALVQAILLCKCWECVWPDGPLAEGLSFAAANLESNK